MNKRILATILASALTLSLVACNKGETQVTENGKKSITYWGDLNPNAVSVIQNYDELLMYQEIEKKFNVDLIFKHPPTGQSKEQFNLMIASRDLPDIMEYTWNLYPGGSGKAIKDNIIVSLNDLVDNQSPNFKKLLSENPELKKEIVTIDGDYFVYPSISLDTYRTFTGSYIRKDWLDELGLSVPETIKEWEIALTAFKEKKGAIAPLTMPKEAIIGDGMFSSAFKMGTKYYLDDNTVKYAPYENAFKEYVTLFKDWYDKGLIDPDVISNDAKSVDSKMISGKAGAGLGPLGSKMGKYVKTAKESGNASYELVGTLAMVKNKGEFPEYRSITPKCNTNGAAAITTKAKDKELAAQILDYFYSEEGAMLKNFGVEGQTFNTVNENFPKYSDLITKNPDGLALAQSIAKYTRGNAPAPGISNDMRYLEQYYSEDYMTNAIKIFNKDIENDEKHMYPDYASLTTEESNELAALASDIETYKLEMVTKFILGTMPLDDFDKFQQGLKDLKLDRILAIKQAAYDRIR